ncbi:MAG: class I SAM-dependent methyltransferase, partial [Bacteroidetes bacterium]|nr:class I SAM-dependent methyltransferase [Bacteroidota bacterium]
MLPEEIERLASDEVQEYIFIHADEDEKKLLLKHKFILDLLSVLIAQQIAARKKAETKLPLFYKTKGIVYPPSLNLEQSSSEATAKFKSEIIRKEIGKKLGGADLTGGFGIDSFFLSQAVEQFDYVEKDVELWNVARHNHLLLKTKISHHNKSAERFLAESTAHYDFIFIDPSRRDSKARKVFSLSDCTPDVTLLLPILLERADFILLKASPLLDIKQGLRELAGIKKVIVLSVANECKEVLFLIQKD